MLNYNVFRKHESQIIPQNILLIFSLVFVFMTGSVDAVSLSTYRIYLDTNQRESSFIVSNNGISAEQCKLNLRHHLFDSMGNMTTHNGETLPDNAADDLIRFSPRNFIITPANAQTIRFMIRRKPNVEVAEYRSYLEVDCEKQSSDVQVKEMVNITPKLLLNVPIVVRTGTLDVKANLENFKIANKSISFDFKREGERSLFGDIEILNRTTGEIIDREVGVSIYPETLIKAFKFSAGNLTAKQLKVRFTENTNYGGNLILEQNVVIND